MAEWGGTEKEWEDLCDNCGKCCELRIESGPISTGAGVMCPYRRDGRCSIYPFRKRVVKSCKNVTPENVLKIGLPDSCAYVKWAKG